MQQQTPIEVVNNFTGGLKTEFTGLNFPENACTSTENCVFTLIGDVTRRLGIDFETNYNTIQSNTPEQAISNYKWNNAGGDGSTQIVVFQVGATLYFARSSSATTTAPLSTTVFSTVNITQFLPSGSTTVPNGTECTYADGNGYLFVFHPNLDTFYCTYSSGTIAANRIIVQIRDVVGVVENIADNVRPLPSNVTSQHLYNLQNQGWASSVAWTATSTTNVNLTVGNISFTVQAGLPITPGVTVTGRGSHNTGFSIDNANFSGVVNFYSGTTLTVDVTSFSSDSTAVPYSNWSITPSAATQQLNTWTSEIGNYPSNADVWWTFKDDTNVFNPAVTIANVTLGTGPAPKGHYILNAFNQLRSSVSGIGGFDVSTNIRPKTGTWFQGRVWYTGVDAAFPTGNSPVSWSEALYFSQVVNTPVDFGSCYEINDPTDENLFNELPTDGGVISIQGCGSIYKLFPIQNGMIIFAANGVWFLTGGSSIGFSANDYALTKISGVKSISRHSYVDVNGFPMFWNEEGIYSVEPQRAGSGERTNEQMGLAVTPITLGTILTFYNSIPLQSKKFARGAYNPITYVLRWVYRSTNETDITSRYQFDSVLNLNTVNKAFYPYTVSNTGPSIAGVLYVEGPGGSTSPSPTFKFITTAYTTNYQITFSEENNSNYLDWQAYFKAGFLPSAVNYVSSFVTGYRLPGNAMVKFQPQYIKMYTRNTTNTQYSIQAVWDFATSGNSGRWSTPQIINSFTTLYDKLFRRIKLRGHGTVLQFQVSSLTGQPFDIMGWSVINDMDAGV